MSLKFDSKKNEINALLDFAGKLAGRRVLEISARVGRLTWRYAAHTALVIAIDPKLESITRSRKDMPDALRGRVRFLKTAIEDYHPYPQSVPFDLALMSWSIG